MPPKRTPPKGKTPKDKTPKSKPRLVAPDIRSRDSSADSSGDGTADTSATTSHAVRTPPIVGVSPDFMAFMQMQERLRREEREIMERHRKEDLERADVERHHQQKFHEAQMQLLQDQLAAMSSRSSDSSNKSTSKLPMFDMVKDKDTFKLWKARWHTHVQGHNTE